MNLYEQLESSLYDVTSRLVPATTVIFSHEGGEEPRGTYISVNVLDNNRVGREYDSFDTQGADPTMSSRTEREVLVRFLFIGQDAGDKAYEMEAKLHNEATRFILYPNNLAVMRISEVRRVPELRDTKWIPYFVLDITFSYATTIDMDIDTIEYISWESNLYKTKP